MEAGVSHSAILRVPLSVSSYTIVNAWTIVDNYSVKCHFMFPCFLQCVALDGLDISECKICRL